MPFSFFTQSRDRISRRLKFLGRALQFMAVSRAAQIVMFLILVGEMGDQLPAELRGPGTMVKIGAYSIGHAVSLFLAGSALLHRKAWGAYFTLFTLLFPLVMRLTMGLDVIRGGQYTIFFSAIGLLLVASVWKELHPKQAVPLDANGDEEEDARPITPRNRGYGEPRDLPPDRMPINPIVTTTAPLNTSNQRDD